MGYEGSCTVMLVTMNPQAKEDIHVRIRQSPSHPDFANSDKIDSLPDNFWGRGNVILLEEFF